MSEAQETLSSGGGAVTKKKGFKLPLAVKLAGGVALLAFVAVWAFSPAPPPPTPQSNLSGTSTNIDSTPGGVNQRNNPDYAQQVALDNDRQAEAAAEGGRGYIPFPETFLEPIEDESENIRVEEEAPPPAPPQRVVATTVQRNATPAPVVQRQAPAQQQAGPQQQQQQENPYVALMSEQFKAITATDRRLPSVLQDVRENREGQGQGQANGGTGDQQVAAATGQPVVNLEGIRRGRTASNGGGEGTITVDDVAAGGGAISGGNGAVSDPAVLGQVEPASTDAEILINAGDILYARVISGVSSDYETPVIAEVLGSGDNDRARLVGTFGVDEITGKMVVQFRQMTWTDGKTRPVTALAVDENTGDTAVRSGIEHRFFARYAPIFASTFVAGLAKAAGEPERTILDGNNGQYSVEAKRTMEEAGWSGLGDAMSVISSDIASNAPKGPKIILARGTTIGIMFVQELREEAR